MRIRTASMADIAQLAAVEAAIHNAGKLLLKDHLNGCIVQAVQSGDEAALKALCEAIDRFV